MRNKPNKLYAQESDAAGIDGANKAANSAASRKEMSRINDIAAAFDVAATIQNNIASGNKQAASKIGQ